MVESSNFFSFPQNVLPSNTARGYCLRCLEFAQLIPSRARRISARVSRCSERDKQLRKVVLLLPSTSYPIVSFSPSFCNFFCRSGVLATLRDAYATLLRQQVPTIVRQAMAEDRQVSTAQIKNKGQGLSDNSPIFDGACVDSPFF